MNDKELCVWLRENSSGSYRPSAEAADRIERLLNVLKECEEYVIAEFEQKIKPYNPAYLVRVIGDILDKNTALKGDDE